MTPLIWKKRAKKRETDVSTIWRWETTDGRYAIERHMYKGTKTYADAWFAIARTSNPPGWDILANRLRTRGGAVARCLSHAKELST
jgi:hypothetical protein